MVVNLNIAITILKKEKMYKTWCKKNFRKFDALKSDGVFEGICVGTILERN